MSITINKNYHFWLSDVCKALFTCISNNHYYSSVYKTQFRVLKDQVINKMFSNEIKFKDNFTEKGLAYWSLKEIWVIHFSWFFVSLTNIHKIFAKVQWIRVIFMAPKTRSHPSTPLPRFPRVVPEYSFHQTRTPDFLYPCKPGNATESYSSLSRTSHRRHSAGSSR